MTEKVALKNNQQKNKKGKQNKKKKIEPFQVIDNEIGEIKENSKPVRKRETPKKTDASFIKLLFKYIGLAVLYMSAVVVFLYIVDYEKFLQCKSGAELLTNKVVDRLPIGVVSVGEKLIRVLQSFGVVIWVSLTNFLNTNPHIKDHWLNVKEISGISSAHFVDYIRTLYRYITEFGRSTKGKLF